MKIAIIGTRGVPNFHGGFEQFAEFFSTHLSSKGHKVSVYNSHNHPYKEKKFNGVNIIHKYDPEYLIGTAGQFIYDFNCILDCRKKNFDIILQLGYTSSSIWHWLMPKKAILATNMDGLEWKRSKYSPMVRRFLKKYNKNSEFIPYGAEIFSKPNAEILTSYNLKQNQYSMIIARLEPENNIETIIKGYCDSNSTYPLIIFGKVNSFGNNLKEKYGQDSRIEFLGANYNQEELNNLRYFSRYYFHGHSVGGTNPSLLEAMASNALIIANDNIFNKSILGSEAVYFDSSQKISQTLNEDNYFGLKESNTSLNLIKISEEYNWNLINKKYEDFLLKIYNDKIIKSK